MCCVHCTLPHNIQGKQETCLAHSQWLIQFSTIVDTVKCSYQNNDKSRYSQIEAYITQGTFLSRTSCLASSCWNECSIMFVTVTHCTHYWYAITILMNYGYPLTVLCTHSELWFESCFYFYVFECTIVTVYLCVSYKRVWGNENT